MSLLIPPDPDYHSYGWDLKVRKTQFSKGAPARLEAWREHKRNTEQEAADASVGGGQRFGMVFSEEGASDLNLEGK